MKYWEVLARLNLELAILNEVKLRVSLAILNLGLAAGIREKVLAIITTFRIGNTELGIDASWHCSRGERDYSIKSDPTFPNA